jgi:hypothetical protein
MGWLFAYARSLKAEIGRLSGEMMAMRSEIHRHCAELPALSKRIENMERM